MVSLIAANKDAIIKSVSCSDDELGGKLSFVFPMYYDMVNSKCFGSDRLTLLDLQLKLIEYAQKYVSEKVDTSYRESRGNNSGYTKSMSVRDGGSFRNAQSRTCAWTKATSFQQFQSDSEAHAKNDSVSYAYSWRTFFDRGYDRTAKDGCGWDRQVSVSRSRRDSNSDSFNLIKTQKKSEGIAQTGNMGGGKAPLRGFLVIPLAVPLEVEINPTMPVPSPTTPECGSIDSLGNVSPCTPLSNIGRGESRTINISFSGSIGIAGIFSLGVNGALSAQGGSEFRQTSVCSYGKTCNEGASDAEAKSASEGATENSSDGNGESSTTELRDIGRTGETHGQSESKLDAFTRSTMRSQNERKTGSDNSAHAEADGSGEGKSWSKNHREAEGKSGGNSTSQSSSRYWSNISTSLSNLWKRIHDESERVRVELAASQSPIVSRMMKPIAMYPCGDRYTNVMNRRSDPCARNLCRC